MTQLGVGEGTVTRLRRNPRVRVEDVGITEASGLTLGQDGYPHPLETTAVGELKVTERTSAAVLEDILFELQLLREGLVMAGIIQNLSDM